MTVRDMLKASFRLAGILGDGENLTASQGADGLFSMRNMLKSWSTSGLLIPSYTREVFALTPGLSSYTIGTGGDFDTERPVHFERASASDSGSNVEQRVRILNVQEWASITDKTIQSNLVSHIYPEGSAPLETVHVWPVPSVSSNLILYTKKPLTDFATLNDDVEFPPGYEEPIIFNLTKRIAPEYGKTLSAEVLEIANESLAQIQRKNFKPTLMKSDLSGLLGRSKLNIFSGSD